MIRVEDSVKLAIPFVLGITLSVIYLHCIGLYREVLGGIALLPVCILLVKIDRKGISPHTPAHIALLLFLTGCFCAFCHNIHSSGIPAESTSELKSIALGFGDKVKATIESIRWEDNQNMALCKALITGDKTSLTKETIEIFRTSGASHILALSGMHLGFLYLIMSRLLSVIGNSPLSGKLRSITIIACSGFFTLMTGASPSLVRAFFFITINEAAKISGRHSSGIHSLCVAMSIQLAVNPENICDPGFQLSYLAMTGLIVLFPLLKKILSGCKDLLVCKIWEISSLSISCQVFTAPAVWYHFNTFPKYFLITNLAAVPLSGLCMLSAIVAVAAKAAGADWPFLIATCEFFMDLFRQVLSIISGLP